MSKFYTFRLLMMFVVVVSLLGLSGVAPKATVFPFIRLGRADMQPCETQNPPGSCSEYWLPAGPSMDTYQATIFTDDEAEYTTLISSNPSIDFSDAPISSGDLSQFTNNPFDRVTYPVHTGIAEIQFNLANNFWGCQFYFGGWNQTGKFPGPCGVEIRQGIAHLIDKVKFANDESSLQGLATANDNPLPPNNGGLPIPNPCGWDASHPESGTQCVVGASGGTAYHLNTAAGVNYAWQPRYGSLDFCAAADHFIAAGLATGKDANCVLTGMQSYVTSYSVNIFVRNDIFALEELGYSLAQEICALFGQGFQWPCSPYLTVLSGPLGAFPGYIVSNTRVSPSWGIYTAGAGFGGYSANPFEEVLERLDEITGVDPFDTSLFWIQNSQFVSGVSGWDSGICSLTASNAGFCPQGAGLPCSQSAHPSLNPANYMYLCDLTFDSYSNQMEYAPCISASGDPATGQTTPTFANCPGTGSLTGVSAGYKAEDLYGQRAYSIPIYTLGVQTVYQSNWSRVINADGAGSNNFFTGLNAWTSTPAVPGTLRQGLSASTKSINPYIASDPYDYLILGNIYDTLGNADPLSNSQYIGALAMSSTELPNSSLSYAPPPGTAETFRFTLRSDIFFQDGGKLTAFDVAFSYLSLVGAGAFDSSGATKMTGVTIFSPNQFDISISGSNSNTSGIFDELPLTSLFILPGKLWSNAGSSTWGNDVSSCTANGANCYPAQYTLSPLTGPFIGSSTIPLARCAMTCTFPATDMNVDPSKGGVANYDPISPPNNAPGILVGTGPWMCLAFPYNPNTENPGSGCSSSGTMDPPVGGSYVLTRFGKGLLPASTLSSIYFRSNGNLALYLWSQDTGDGTKDFLNFTSVAACVGSTSSSCSHWMMGIGGCGGTSTTQCTVSQTQESIVNRFVGLNWSSIWNYPVGLRPLPAILYEGPYTLRPASVAGCANPYDPSSSASGGYDC